MATIGDIVLVYYEDHPAFFARIEDISADHKPNWFHVRLLVLQVPLAEVVWILREEYINGETFTMGGHQIRLEPVSAPEKKELTESSETGSQKKDTSKKKVVSIFDKRKNRRD
nr:hypothetical protein [Desulfobacterales bacterium]